MRYNSVHIIYFSPTHTSRSIAECIVKGTGISDIRVTDLTYEEPLEMEIDPNEMTLVTVPVYGGRVAETALERLKKIKGKQTPVILGVLYGNRDYEDALLELTDWAVRAGFIPVAGGAFIGEHSYSRPDMPIAAGRPDQADRHIASCFGKKIARKLDEIDTLLGLPELPLKGQFPYKQKMPKTLATPFTDEDLCTRCGYCIDICPTQAIGLKNEMTSDPERCIKCCACVKQCPAEARVFNTPYTEMLFRNFSARKEPELFL